ncbi:MAG: hypothetical protein EOO39_50185, partial [Cytophagaceae bacterium]
MLFVKSLAKIARFAPVLVAGLALATVLSVSDAIWAFVNAAPPQTASTVFYADPGSADNAVDSGNPITLTWNGFMDTAYVGGNPLNFWYAEAYETGAATWSNVSITLDTNTAPPPTSTSFTQPSAGNTVSLNASLAASSINWYSFV